MHDQNLNLLLTISRSSIGILINNLYLLASKVLATPPGQVLEEKLKNNYYWPSFFRACAIYFVDLRGRFSNRPTSPFNTSYN